MLKSKPPKLTITTHTLSVPIGEAMFGPDWKNLTGEPDKPAPNEPAHAQGGKGGGKGAKAVKKAEPGG